MPERDAVICWHVCRSGVEHTLFLHRTEFCGLAFSVSQNMINIVTHTLSFFFISLRMQPRAVWLWLSTLDTAP